MSHYSRPAGTVAFVWRLLLTTGTGSIFGFLVARQPYDAALFAPLFIALSFSYGLAVYLLALIAAYRGTGRSLGDIVLRRLSRLLAIFIVAALYFVAILHLTNLYFAQRQEVERFLLVDGGSYTALFWLGQVFIGSVAPLCLLFHPRLGKSVRWVALAALLVVLGGVAQMYVTIIGGQAYPLLLFPGMQAASSFYDGIVYGYAPSIPEIMLGIGGVAIAALIVVLAIKLWRFIPDSLDDRSVASPEDRLLAAGSAVA